jgi:SnoaL-like domain
MAKKVAKKNAGGKGAMKAGGKAGAPAKKSVATKSAGKKVAAKAGAAKAVVPTKLVGMHPISTGSGASAAEIGAAVVAHLNSGAHDDTPLWDKYWSKDFVSIEGMGANLAWHGRAAVKEKCDGWMSENIVHGCRAEGPFVGSTGFAVLITMDVEERKTGNRRTMRETGVYTVQQGKVIREEFMYS